MEVGILKEFGLTGNEVEIFLSVAQEEALSATQIAKKTGLNRPYTYYAIERLLEKGYLSQIKNQGKRCFRAVDFKQISSLEEHKLEMLRHLFGDLEKLRNKNQEETSVEILKGKFVIKNIFKKIASEVKPKEEVLYWGLDEQKMESVEPAYLRKLLNSFEKNRITEKIIIGASGRKLEYAKTSQYRHLQKELLGNTAKIIYQNTVIDLVYGYPLYAIVTKNPDFADVARKQFRFFWKVAKT
jgi:sugar-specific transcriptional regulator TrmB